MKCIRGEFVEREKRFTDSSAVPGIRPVRPIGDDEFKTAAQSGFACLLYRDTRDGEDLPDQKEAEAGIFPESPGEEVFPLIIGNARPVIQAGYDKDILFLAAPELYRGG